MLKVKTKLGVSPVKNVGIGLFADEFIQAGTVIWEFVDVIDKCYSKEFIKSCSEKNLKNFLKKYCYHDIFTDLYVFCGDNGRFFNHSDNANCLEEPNSEYQFGRTIAVRDIQENEELTCDYYEFDGEANEKLDVNPFPFLPL